MTLIEVMVAITVLTVSVYMLTATISSAGDHRATKRETAAAAEAAKNILEEMRSIPFESVFRLYNEDPDDDPGGPGTGVGPHFAVEGLTALPNDLDGLTGRVRFASPGPQLREDSEDHDLGMPRDLNGDHVVDGNDHVSDAIVLPVIVSVEWTGRAGPRSFKLATMLAKIAKSSQ